ncbi:hypothetical protein [Halobacillus salinus]|uniref:hypothetical protein n=1 Tax=Halobacillus salinus TaxID=192814 RepID=UPI0009A6F171|nr:hypothetical protein [Halobacillus salinus]
MHYTERVLVYELVKKYNVDPEMIQKLLQESKKSSYQNEKNSKKVAEIDMLISYYVNKEEGEKH